MSLKKFASFIHLDLKGAPPKPIYLRSIWPLLKRWGITGVLLEWEDCFPYSGDLSLLSNNIFALEDVQEIVQSMQENELEIIPLVQIFGHLEFVLKHMAFAELREAPLFPDSICPSHPNSLELVLAIVDQVILFHGPGLRRFHIGADEVWHMGLCERCRARYSAGETKEDLFLKFVCSALQCLKEKWPELDFIMWDDMLRPLDEPLLNASGMKTLVEPMVWHYLSADYFSLSPEIWKKYSIFGGAWVAGAFKGATGSCQLIPVIDHHCSNTLQWSKYMENAKTPVRGFVFTGWSRYDHFACLCETLPCGLVSLGVCLRTLQGECQVSAVADVEKDLQTFTTKSPSKVKNPCEIAASAGYNIYQSTAKLKELRHFITQMINSEHLQTWMNEWQVRNRRVNPMQIVPILPNLKRMSDEMNTLEASLKHNMSIVFYPPTVEEWCETYITIIHNKLKAVIKTAEDIVAQASGAAVKMAVN